MNQVTITGKIMEPFVFSHNVLGEDFFTSKIVVNRKSGIEDYIPIMVSERILEDRFDVGDYVMISGQFRSYNLHTDLETNLILHVFVTDIKKSEASNDNMIVIDGYLCKTPVFRKTPLGREIADLLVAVNRMYGKSDYIPCICWGRNAKYIAGFETGTEIKLTGRIQSREYYKMISDTEYVSRTIYEVSIYTINIV